MPDLTQYRKTISALVIGLLGWGTVVVTSDPASVSASEWLQLGTAFATALGVYAFPNTLPSQSRDAGGRFDGGQAEIITIIKYLALIVVVILVLRFLATVI